METIRVNIKEFQEKYNKEALIPEDIMEYFTECFLNGQEYACIRATVYDEMDEKQKKIKIWQNEYNTITTHRLKGYEFEQIGDIDNAIVEFSHCIELGETAKNNLFHAYAHAFDRIIINLHKNKSYQREIDYINQYLSHREIGDKNKIKYQDRVEKLKNKVNGKL